LAKRVVVLTLVLLLAFPLATRADSPAVEIASDSAVLIDALSGQTVFAKNEDVRRSPASLTKIMTLVVAFEAIDAGKVSLQDKAMASPEACRLGGTQVYAKPGEVFTLEEWLRAVAIGSANDASVVVAEHIGGTEQRFAQMMNETASRLGMHDSNFMNSHGLDEEGHYTTARDMAILGSYACKFPGLLQMTGTYQSSFRDGTFGLDNRNKLVRFYTGCDGLKTGHTDEALYCLVATAKRQDTRFVSAVMGGSSSDERFADARRLLDYGFANYSSALLAECDRPLVDVKVYGGSTPQVSVVVEKVAAVTVPKGAQEKIERQIVVSEGYKAPLKKGDALGELIVSLEGEQLASFALVAEQSVPKAGVPTLMVRFMKRVLCLYW